jgi:hypothetical protein
VNLEFPEIRIRTKCKKSLKNGFEVIYEYCWFKSGNAGNPENVQKIQSMGDSSESTCVWDNPSISFSFIKG